MEVRGEGVRKMSVPTEICAWDPELNDYAVFTLVGEHGPYWVYESKETGRSILIPKGDVWRFEDMGPCKKLKPR